VKMTPKNPFEDPEHPIDYNIRGKDVKPKPLPEKKPKKKIDPMDQLVYLTGDSQFFFENVPYRGGNIAEVELNLNPLSDGDRKNLAQWKEYSHADPVINKWWEVPDAELLYQLMRRLYELRNDGHCMGAKDCKKILSGQFTGDDFATLTSVEYEDDVDVYVSGEGPAGNYNDIVEAPP